jgi:hypothetical protein
MVAQQCGNLSHAGARAQVPNAGVPIPVTIGARCVSYVYERTHVWQWHTRWRQHHT